MTEPSTAVKEKLARATARRANEMAAAGGVMPAPPTPQQQPPLKQPTVLDTMSPDGSPTAGSGTAKYVLLDHYFGGSNGTFWTFDGSTWRAAGTAEPSDEQGVAQVAFAANRVDMWWDANDTVTIVRCWKYL